MFFDIPGYIGFAINKSGVVRRSPREVLVKKRGSSYKYVIEERVLEPYRGEYLTHTLHTGSSERKCVSLHRLLAITFIPNPDNLPQINHKDGNKHNNSLDNLEWCTSKDNMNHAVDSGLLSLSGSSNGNSKLTEDQVKEIKRRLVCEKGTDIAKDYGVSKHTISKINTGKYWRHV